MSPAPDSVIIFSAGGIAFRAAGLEPRGAQ